MTITREFNSSPSIRHANVGKLFWELNSKMFVSKLRKSKKRRCVVFTSTT